MKNNKKGFTLAELLIVVAIIGVLAAIAIPIYSSQMSSAQAAVDAANERSARSMAVAQYLTESCTGAESFYFTLSSNNDLSMIMDGNKHETTKPTTPTGKYIEVKLSAGGAYDAASLGIFEV